MMKGLPLNSYRLDWVHHCDSEANSMDPQTLLIVSDVTKGITKLNEALKWVLRYLAISGDYIIVLGVHDNRDRRCCRAFQISKAFGALIGGVHKGAVDCIPAICACPDDMDWQTFLQEEISRKKEMYEEMYEEILRESESESHAGRGLQVKLDVKILPGYPRKQIAVEQAVVSRANWVIFDRHMKRDRQHLKENLSCNLVIMKNDGQANIIKVATSRPLWTPLSCSLDPIGVSARLTVKGFKGFQVNKQKPGQSDNEASALICGYSADSSSDFGTTDSSGESSRESSMHGQQKSSKSAPETIDVDDKLTELPVNKQLLRRRTSSSGDKCNDHGHVDNIIDKRPLVENLSSTPDSATRKSGGRWTRTNRVFPGVSTLQALCSTCRNNTSSFGPRPPKEMPLDNLLKATNGFHESKFITQCGSYSVYHGFLEDGQAVSVKRLNVEDDSDSENKTYDNEVKILHHVCHLNVVTLIGYCSEKDERILVHEYICNKTLSWHLFSPLKPGVMSWITRRKIALEVARALVYLHEGCRPGSIVHSALGPENILLTHDFLPLICNFSNAKVLPHSDGTTDNHARSPKRFGTPDRYLAPECTETPNITAKADVYAFGVLLLELVTGGQSMVPQSFRMNPDMEVPVDPELEGNYDVHEYLSMIFAASLCIKTEASIRPTMSKSVHLLQRISKGRISKIAGPLNNFKFFLENPNTRPLISRGLRPLQ